MQKKTAINYRLLKELIRFESYKEDEKIKCSSRISQEFLNIGFDVKTYREYGAPIVYAHYDAEATKDILFYMHYDVKPVGDISAWNTSPFNLYYDANHNKLYGRGTGDDKGQIYAAIKGIEKAIGSAKKLNYNVSVLIEGDEENSSPGLEAFVKNEINEKFYDKVVVLDSHWLNNSPVIYLGCRGQLDVAIEYENEKMNNDYHAGNFGGIYEGACRYLLAVLNLFMTDAEKFINNANSNNRDTIKNAISMTYFSSGDAKRSLIPKSAISRIDIRYIDVSVAENIIELLNYYVESYGITYDIKQREDGFYNKANMSHVNEMKAIIEDVTSLNVIIQDYCGAYLPLNKMKDIVGVKYVVPLAQTDENNHAPNENIAVDNLLYGIEIINRILVS